MLSGAASIMVILMPSSLRIMFAFDDGNDQVPSAGQTGSPPATCYVVPLKASVNPSNSFVSDPLI